MKKIIYILFLISFTFSAKSSDKLRFAADAESGAPYIFFDPNSPTNLVGFEVEIIQSIAKELNMEIEFIQTQWDGLVPGLARDNYDVVINGLEITEDRKNEVLFSIPYYFTFEQIVVRKDYDGIENLEDMKGKAVGTLEGALAERIMRNYGGIDVRTYDSEANAYTELENRRLDAVLIDAPVAMYYAGWNPQLKLIGNPIGEVSYGVVLRKEDSRLAENINDALRKMIADGELREILERWNLWNPAMAKYLNDYEPSPNSHIKYEEYLKTQSKKLTFSERMERYYTFAPLFIDAAWMTLKLSILSMLLAIVFGLFLALMRVYAPFPIYSIAVAFIEIIRGTPLLIQLFFIYFALPMMGINLPRFAAAVLALGINYAAYEAEIYRAGLFAVPKGQMEAAISLGLTRTQSLRYIVLPQAFRIVLPPITNDFISLLKDSSLVSVIALVELTKLYGVLAATYFDYVGIGIIIALIYLLLGLPFVKLSKIAENTFANVPIERNQKGLSRYFGRKYR